jgi:hypothetical protein
MRACHLVVVAELSTSLLVVDNKLAHLGHKSIYSIVAHPGAALMHLLQATYLIEEILVLETLAIRACMWCPGVSGKRHSCDRVGVTIAQSEV